MSDNVWVLPIKTVSESNCAEHWTAKHKRHKMQRRQIRMAFLTKKMDMTLPCRVKLTRIAPRSLDAHDNLRMSLKWVVDAIADNLLPGKACGRADDSDQISWDYDQERGKMAVKIEFKKI